jgi:indole-3-glycerol phosphate synthase
MILDDIVASSRLDLRLKKERVPLAEIERRARATPRPLDFASALRGENLKLIAEVKKASPSRGLIVPDFDHRRIARSYAENHVAAISVLTEPRYFQGNLEYLADIHRELGPGRPPLLRKDFVFDPYQVYEARAYGADAILLIVAILDPELLRELLDLSHELQLECLVEVHRENEVLAALNCGAGVIGINNRDLRTFGVDLNNTRRLRPLIPPDRTVVSESGISVREDVRKLAAWRINAALVGESLLVAPDIGKKIKELL